MAKNTKIQCTRIKLLIQTAIHVTCQKSIDSFLLKVSPFTKNQAVWLKELVQHKIILKMGSVCYAKLPTDGFLL